MNFIQIRWDLRSDIDEYYNVLKDKNVKIAVDIKDELYGIKDFTVEDINGYKLTFNQAGELVDYTKAKLER